MRNTGCRIDTRIRRPDPALIERFRGLPAANLGDCMNRIAAMDPAIRPFTTGGMLGCAYTVRLPEGDNLLLHKALDLAEPGDVLVIDAGGSLRRAIFGELMVRYCELRGLGGLVVDGSIRDVDAIAGMGVPVYAKGVSPNGPYKNGPGEIGGAVAVGGQVVRPGDIVVGDSDGVVVVRPEDAEEVLEKVGALMDNEERILAAMDREGTYVRPWVDKKLRELGCEMR